MPTDLTTIDDNENWLSATARLSVVIPSYRCDATPLLHALAACTKSDEVEIIVYDDGSPEHEFRTSAIALANKLPVAIRVVSCPINQGRSRARNAALAHARGEWILLLDADMLPDSPNFFDRYLLETAVANIPRLVVGGFSLKLSPNDKRFALHRWQATRSECRLARERQTSPARYVFSSNVLAHRDVLSSVPFDENFVGWGFEDTDWGIRVSRDFAIQHIDNTATHMGLDLDSTLMGKYAKSGPNFALLAVRHPEDVVAFPLYRAAVRLQRLPFRSQLRSLTKLIAASRFMPIAMRGTSLKLWRALIYSDAISARRRSPSIADDQLPLTR